MASIDALQHAFNTGVDVHSLTASQARLPAGAAPLWRWQTR